jgi:hypothetical protein
MMTAHVAPTAIIAPVPPRPTDALAPEVEVIDLTPAPHDGLLLLAALTGNRRLLRAWFQVEQVRERAPEGHAA